MNHQSTCNGVNIPQLEAESLISTKFLNVMDDSQLVGVPVTVAGDSIVSDHTTVLSVEVKTDVKRKRGRPPRGQAKLPPVKKQKDDEDVCFICFDGGSLVLCDRRSCPKAYHPACIKRDEAFFRSKARWNCGWHICSVCQKAAHYMCYTCPFSLCKGCTKDSSYLCVRGDKGFCTTCMKVIMLIENEQRNTEMTQVDFDDASNWEYLFKIYYISLKEKLSLTTKDLAEAKTPWKESASMTGKGQSSNVHGGGNNFKSAVSSMSSGHLKGGDSIRQNSCESLKLLNKASLTTEKQCTDNDTSSQGRNDWATKELLEFVAYMKNGDTSVLSQFDVQSLVLDYIKRSNLHDPCEKNHVVCDSRLETLFGKPRVGHLEMLKLLEFHFLMKKEAANDDLVEGRVVDINAVQVPSIQSNSISMNKDKKYKTCKKGEECALQASLTEYAAVNVHNINLIYLRRKLMENLIQVREKFHEMVVGAMVRIRVSGDEHKQDMYRLVQVVGTTKVSAPYQISNITTDIMLEVSNLDKKEVLSIDAISDQDFSEHECRHLRQSVKSGFVKRFTVGEIQEKAMQLQVVRLSNNLEAEMSQLNHLRDRASKNGVEEEVRECVEKLQLLKAPEERQRRLSQIPEVSSDPNMDPNYESEEDAVEHDSRKQGHHEKPCNPEYNREGSEPISLRQREDISGDNNSSSPPCERIKNLCATSYPDKEESAAKALQRLSEEKYAWRLNSLERGELNNQAVTSTALFSMRNTPFAYNGETKLWHYRDLNGYIRGPFSIVELQRWSIAGYFSPDMRIWANDKLDDSVLLTDALEGHFHKALPGLNDISSQVREVRGTSDSNLYNSSFVWSENTNATEDGRQNEGNWHDNIADANSKCKNVFKRSDRLGTESSAWTAPIVSYNKDITAGTASQDQGSFKGNSLHNMLLSSTLTVRDDASHPHELNSKVKRCDSDSDHKISLSQGTTICNNTGHILGNHCNCQGCANQVSGKSVTHSHVNCSPNNLDLNSVFSPTKSTDSPDQSGEVIINLHSPSRNTSNIDLECEADKNVSLSFNVNGPDFCDQPNSTLKINNNHQKCLAAEKKRCVSLNIPVQESVSSWGSTTNIMAGKSQLPDITDEWGGYTSAPVKHSIEWDSNLISVSSSSLHDHVGTTTSRSELTHFTLSNPASNFFSWHTTGSEPIEFTTLAEESVSDLLAEVDAMESQCGMVSPTSMMNCGEDLINLNLEMA